MIVHTGQAARCTGCAEDVAVMIGDVATYTPIMVVENGDADLILGRPWQAAARLGCDTHDDGSVTCRIYSRDGSRYVEFLTYRPTAKNRCFRETIWPIAEEPGAIAAVAHNMAHHPQSKTGNGSAGNR
jgi:hypothetical protein